MTELEKSARALWAAPEPTIDFDEWLRLGMDNGFIGPPVCETHDGLPTSEAEDDEFMDGADPCIHMLRLYPDEVTRKRVERNHPPSVWRRTNMGL